MKHSLSATLLVLALPFATGLQEPTWDKRDPKQDPEKEKEATGDPDEPVSPRDIFGRIKETNPLAKSLIGCWQIMDLDIDGYSAENRDLLGYLMFTDEFVAFELQASWDDPTRLMPDAYQTFISEYRLGANGSLQLKTLVGSYLDRDSNSLEWETPNFGRRLRVEQVTRSQIVLHFDTGGTMTFARRLPSSARPRTILGRPAEAGDGDPDIYGRRPVKKDDEDQD